MGGRDYGPFLRTLKEAAALIGSGEDRRITVVHHNDTDGIASGAILRRALERAGFQVENLPIERVHPAFLPAIHAPARRIILYVDLGGQGAGEIARHIREGSRVLILDHHKPGIGGALGLHHVNPEFFGIDGDRECSAATLACLFALELGSGNEDMAPLALVGSEGDHQLPGGRAEGLNLQLLQTALSRGDLRRDPESGAGVYRIPRLQGESLQEVSDWIIALAVNGYYRGGSELALDFCLEGPDRRIRDFAREMGEIQREKFRRELEALGEAGAARETDVSWVDVGPRFHPLGLKAIGLFCEELVRTGGTGKEDYVVGFQSFPRDNPYLGSYDGRETKVSFRVTPALRKRIELGEKPDLMALVPEAAARVGGFAEACHRFSAACTIPEDRIPEFIRIFARGAGAPR